MAKSQSKVSGTYHHGDLAASLIDAALPILAKEGPAHLSLRQIARTAGVSHGAPAHHFGDKTGLLTQVAIQGHRQLGKALRASQEDEPLMYQRLVKAGKAYVHFAVEHPGYFSVMFQSELINSHNEEYGLARQESAQVLAAVVKALAEDAQVTDDEVDATLVALWSQVHGFSTLWLAGNFGDPLDQALLEKKLDKMLQAIQPRL